MTLVPRLLAAFAASLCLALPAFAQDGVHIQNPYARTSGAAAVSGAVFLVIENHSGEADRLLSATSDAAERAELHTNKEGADGVVQMLPVPEGLEVPAHGSRVLDRGGDHLMLLGLTRPLQQGDTLTLTLTFARAGIVTVTVPVDNARAPGAMPAAHDKANHVGSATL